MSALIETGDGAAAALLRVSLGVMFIAHSVVLKLFVYGLAGTAGYFASIGLPGWLAYAVFAAEAIGGVLLVANVATGWVSLALVPVLAGALWAHSGNGWVFSNENGGWEYPLFLIVVSVAVALQAFAAQRTAAVRHAAKLGGAVQQA
ncbi:MAG TPA: DoxX family protein [Steroidobacteraceae bacterium]|jgi:putative oxidoreductase|nr:DoxX family protein [Steroidobacteraceae bacterium]